MEIRVEERRRAVFGGMFVGPVEGEMGNHQRCWPLEVEAKYLCGLLC
jgi:hypothetical protein